MRATREQLKQQADDATREATLYMLAFGDAVRGEVPWGNWRTTKDGDAYRFGWSRLTAGHGGLFFWQFRHPGQSDTVHVQYLDRMDAPVFLDRDEDCFLAEAIACAKREREKAWKAA